MVWISGSRSQGIKFIVRVYVQDVGIGFHLMVLGLGFIP